MFRLSLALLVALLTATQASAETFSREQLAVKKEIVRHNTPSAVALRITVERISGKYAMGKVTSADGTGETETVYLERKKGRWTVLDQGTGATPYDAGIPLGAW